MCVKFGRRVLPAFRQMAINTRRYKMPEIKSRVNAARKNRNVKVVPAGWGGVNSPFRNGNVPTEDKTWIMS